MDRRCGQSNPGGAWGPSQRTAARRAAKIQGGTAVCRRRGDARMRKQTGWLVWLVAAGATLMPALAYGQGAEVPPEDPIIPLPLGHDRMENGGFFVAGEFLFWRQTVPLHNQVVAVRGVLDQDGTISSALG